MSVTAIVLIKAQTEKVTALAEALVEVSGVREVFSVAGQYDLIAIVHASDNERLADVVSDKIRKLDGIAGSETLIAFRTYSRAELETAYSIGLS